MKHLMIILSFIVLNIQTNRSQINSDTIELDNQDCWDKVLEVEDRIDSLLKKKTAELFFLYQSILNENMNLHMLCDSLRNNDAKLCAAQEKDRKFVMQMIDNAQKSIIANQSVVKKRTLWEITIATGLILIIAVVAYLLIRRIMKCSSSINEVRKEAIKLDNKLLEIAEQQMKISATTNNQGATAVDHSLALKVADEIVRIELNLSRMDSSIKGYRQLSRAVQRIKDNFSANGYEIVDMLGKPYNEGMKVIANFVPDETLEQGKQIITGITKPQINYNGKMIQSAQITVSQNI